MKVRGRVWVVTGAGSGMGRELVLQLLSAGARVAAVDLREGSLSELRASVGTGPAERLSTHAFDVSKVSEAPGLVQKVFEAHGTVDGLINNAGIIQPFERFEALGESTLERIFWVNFFGPLALIRAFLPALRQRPQAHVVNVASMGGFVPVPGQSLYCASKAALKLFTEALYAELLGTPVRVSVVLPGAVATNIMKNSGVELRGQSDSAQSRTTSAEAAARTILRGVERDRLHILVGPDSKLMYALSRLMPLGAIRLIQRQMAGLLGPPGPS